MQACRGVSVRLWSSEAWREQAVGWIDRRLAEAGLARTGEVEQPRVRPWATVLRAPTEDGDVWMKAAGPATAFEAGLYEPPAGAPSPEAASRSLDHNDLHAWNVLGAGTFRFYDWGDSVVAHAFASLLLPLTDVRNRADDDVALRLRDAYLEAWSDLAPHAELVETLELAVRVGWIARSHTWLRAVGHANEERWATAPLESLAQILD